MKPLKIPTLRSALRELLRKYAVTLPQASILDLEKAAQANLLMRVPLSLQLLVGRYFELVGIQSRTVFGIDPALELVDPPKRRSRGRPTKASKPTKRTAAKSNLRTPARTQS